MSEKVLAHIIHYQTEVFKSDLVPNFQSHLDKIENIPSQDIHDIIIRLEKLGYIKADIKPHRTCSVELTHIGKTYFTEKEKVIKEKHIRHIHDCINTAISIFALIVAIIALFI